jgi:hypothetical protein
VCRLHSPVRNRRTYCEHNTQTSEGIIEKEGKVRSAELLSNTCDPGNWLKAAKRNRRIRPNPRD